MHVNKTKKSLGSQKTQLRM